jgi:hypothetical protein
MYEYMTLEFHEEGEIIDTSQMLEHILDSKGRMGWKLHTVEVIELTTEKYHAVLIFERPFTN